MTTKPAPAGAHVGVDTATSACAQVLPSVASKISTSGSSLIVRSPGPSAIGGSALADWAASRLTVEAVDGVSTLRSGGRRRWGVVVAAGSSTCRLCRHLIDRERGAGDDDDAGGAACPGDPSLTNAPGRARRRSRTRASLAPADSDRAVRRTASSVVPCPLRSEFGAELVETTGDRALHGADRAPHRSAPCPLRAGRPDISTRPPRADASATRRVPSPDRVDVPPIRIGRRRLRGPPQTDRALRCPDPVEREVDRHPRDERGRVVVHPPPPHERPGRRFLGTSSASARSPRMPYAARYATRYSSSKQPAKSSPTPAERSDTPKGCLKIWYRS